MGWFTLVRQGELWDYCETNPIEIKWVMIDARKEVNDGKEKRYPFSDKTSQYDLPSVVVEHRFS